MSDQDIDKKYVSPYDQFLFEFDVKHQKSASQLKEIKKHQRIAEQRDHAQCRNESDDIWEDF